MELIDITVNCPSDEIADAIAEALIEARLIACANRLAPVQSRYFWDGRVETAQEVPLLLHTRRELFEAVVEVVRRHHPDETPSILAVRIEAVNQDYADWLVRETAAAQG